MKKLLAIAVSMVLMASVAHANGSNGKVKVVGEITAIDRDAHTITVRSKNGINETFAVDTRTTIRKKWRWVKKFTFDDLKVGQHVKLKYSMKHAMPKEHTEAQVPKTVREIKIIKE